MKVSIQTSGTQKIIKGLKKVTAGMQNMKPAHMAAVIEYEGWIKKNFLKNGALHKGGRWKDTADSTKEWKREHGYNPSRILVGRTGNLQSRWFRESNNRYGLLRSAVEYSYYHEFGKGVPKRKIFAVDSQVREIVNPAYQRFMHGLVKFK